jgi:hypothetical protein
MRFLALFTLTAASLLSQPLARFDRTLIIYGSSSGNRARNIVPQSRVFVNATTYSDSTGSVACPGNAQVVLKGTSLCTSSSDNQGSFGFWLPDGDYSYTLQLPAGNIIGPFPFTVTGDSPLRPPQTIDIRSFGAVCNGSNPNSTVDVTAMPAVLAAGWKNIFIPANCTWTVPGGIVPGGTTGINYYGENWLTSRIQPVSTGNAALQTEPLVQMHNINQAHSLNAPPESAPNFDCPNGHYYNLSNGIDPVFTSSCYSEQLIYLNGDTIPGYSIVGIAGTNCRNNGIGDCYFAGTYNTNGVAFRGDIESGNGAGFLCDVNGGTGGQCFSVVENVASNSMIPYTWFSTKRTSGKVVQFNHRVSTFSGDVFYVNMADVSGSFTGKYIDFLKAGVPQFQVDNTGMIIAGGANTISPLITSNYLGTKSLPITVVNGANQNLDIGISSFIILTGASAPFSIGGLLNGTDGRHLKIFNLTGQIMTINNLDGGSAAFNKIFIPKGSNYVCPNTYCVIDLIWYPNQWLMSDAN